MGAFWHVFGFIFRTQFDAFFANGFSPIRIPAYGEGHSSQATIVSNAIAS